LKETAAMLKLIRNVEVSDTTKVDSSNGRWQN